MRSASPPPGLTSSPASVPNALYQGVVLQWPEAEGMVNRQLQPYVRRRPPTCVTEDGISCELLGHDPRSASCLTQGKENASNVVCTMGTSPRWPPLTDVNPAANSV